MFGQGSLILFYIILFVEKGKLFNNFYGYYYIKKEDILLTV